MNGCKCKSCKAACETKPGWFTPDQIRFAASSKGMSEKDFFDRYLSVDWYESHPDFNYNDVFVLSPAATGRFANTPGGMFSVDPIGVCIFFNDDGLCDIHLFKPFECAELKCESTKKEAHKRHTEVAKAWIDHQDYIRRLLGYEPVSESFEGTIFDF